MIYCVEDDRSIRELIIYALKTNGFDAVGFGEGKPFFAALDDRLPDLVLLDIMLPGEYGIEILRQLKASAKTKHIPVIVLTAKAQSMTRSSDWIPERIIILPSLLGLWSYYPASGRCCAGQARLTHCLN